MKRRTPAAKALVGALALRDEKATINQAFRLAGYDLAHEGDPRLDLSMRFIMRNGRTLKAFHLDGEAIVWLSRLGRKLEALEVRHYGCTCSEERYCRYHERKSLERDGMSARDAADTTGWP